jgi:hypothetical protein
MRLLRRMAFAFVVTTATSRTLSVPTVTFDSHLHMYGCGADTYCGNIDKRPADSVLLATQEGN